MIVQETLGKDGQGADRKINTSSVTEGQLVADGSSMKITLMGLLEKLISLDPSGIFMDPVDDSFAPNYSKVIKTPMCFATMQEKITTQQYSSWRLFVDDFERICYNAMKYNQKRSKIWTAASMLLRQGKRYLEGFAEHGDSIVGTTCAVEVKPVIPVGGVLVKDEVVENDSTPRKTATNAGATSSLDVEKPELVEHVLNGMEIKSSQTNEDLSLVSESRENFDNLIIPAIDTVIGDYSIKQDPERATVSNTSEDVKWHIQMLRARSVNDDRAVDILGCHSVEDLRLDSRGEATECSSSFDNTESKEESAGEQNLPQPMGEVESEMRDGNGALASAFAEEDEVAGLSERNKKGLNADWKKYRRGIEWRCRWLEIRLNELRVRAEKYDRLLEEKRAKKPWQSDFGASQESAARTTQLTDIPKQGHILRRRPRRQVEDTVDLDAYMARHPLFSRYDKKKKREEDSLSDDKIESSQQLQSQPLNFADITEPERRFPQEDTEDKLAVSHSVAGGQDSMEQILWKVEALHARVEKMKHQLSRGAPPRNSSPLLSIPKPPVSNSRPLTRVTLPNAHRPSSSKGRPPSGQSAGLSGAPCSVNGTLQKQSSASNHMRRKSSDYDINNMVMPVNVGAKYVEHIKHADIWTPHWRIADGVEASDQCLAGSSSEEDTDDERFKNRHSEMEINERQQRYMLPPKRSPDGESAMSGKGRSKFGVGKGAGKLAGRSTGFSKASGAQTSTDHPDLTSPLFPGSIPKGKRRKRPFNSSCFTPNHAQRLIAAIAENSSSFQTSSAVLERNLNDESDDTKLARQVSFVPYNISNVGNPHVEPQAVGAVVKEI